MKCFRVGVQDSRFQRRDPRIGQKALRCNSDVSVGSIRGMPVASPIGQHRAKQATTGSRRMQPGVSGDTRIREDEFNKFQRATSILVWAVIQMPRQPRMRRLGSAIRSWKISLSRDWIRCSFDRPLLPLAPAQAFWPCSAAHVATDRLPMRMRHEARSRMLGLARRHCDFGWRSGAAVSQS